MEHVPGMRKAEGLNQEGLRDIAQAFGNLEQVSSLTQFDSWPELRAELDRLSTNAYEIKHYADEDLENIVADKRDDARTEQWKNFAWALGAYLAERVMQMLKTTTAATSAALAVTAGTAGAVFAYKFVDQLAGGVGIEEAVQGAVDYLAIIGQADSIPHHIAQYGATAAGYLGGAAQAVKYVKGQSSIPFPYLQQLVTNISKSFNTV